MSTCMIKKRPLSRYLKDYKHSQTNCAHCGKALERISLVFRGQALSRDTLIDMKQNIDDTLWQRIEPELMALCRFCSDVYCHCQPTHFDIQDFKQYLLEQTEMCHSTIREYVVRLRRLDNMLGESDFPSEKFCGSEHQWKALNKIEGVSCNNYLIALRKYDQYLACKNLDRGEQN